MAELQTRKITDFFVDDVKNYSMMVEMYIEFRHLKQLCYKFIKK